MFPTGYTSSEGSEFVVIEGLEGFTWGDCELDSVLFDHSTGQAIAD